LTPEYVQRVTVPITKQPMGCDAQLTSGEKRPREFSGGIYLGNVRGECQMHDYKSLCVAVMILPTWLTHRHTYSF